MSNDILNSVVLHGSREGAMAGVVVTVVYRLCDPTELVGDGEPAHLAAADAGEAVRRQFGDHDETHGSPRRKTVVTGVSQRSVSLVERRPHLVSEESIHFQER